MNESQSERIMFPCTIEFKNELAAIAQSRNVSVSDLIKRTMIESLAMTAEIPANARGRSSKYATAEEREAAQREYRKNRNELMKRLMNEHRAKSSK